MPSFRFRNLLISSIALTFMLGACGPATTDTSPAAPDLHQRAAHPATGHR